MAFNNEIEKVKAEIKMLEKKLSFLEELKKTKTPVKEAYKRVYGNYPITDIADTCWDNSTWTNFEQGYIAAKKDYKVGEYQEPEEQKWDAVRESVKWCEEHPDKDPLDCLKSQNPEQVADGLKEAFREAVKQGIVSSVDKPKKNRDALNDMMNEMIAESKLKQKTLYDVIDDWWSDVFTNSWDDRNCINTLVDRIELFLPKEQSAEGSQNAYVECTVEGFNDCLDTIKRKLR